MDNTFANALEKMSSLKNTENGAVAYDSTSNAVYDLFALGGAYRTRESREKINLFKTAFNENPNLALKCLFYLRDVRGGQGERQFFRDCFTWFIDNAPKGNQFVKNLLELVPEYGRWDDLIYIYDNTFSDCYRKAIINIINHQLEEDLDSEYPSLLAKWMPSENASSIETKRLAKQLMKNLELSPKWYRKTLSYLRKKIDVLERLMSSQEWDKIDFSKIPSRAGFIYRKAFSSREETATRYSAFMSSGDTSVHSDTLYPYQIIDKCGDGTSDDVIQKYWDCLPNYFSDNNKSAICVVDTSGSMWGTPLKVALSLGLYCAERLNGPFKNTFITFSGNPKVQKIKGSCISEKISNMKMANWGVNTNLESVFNLLLGISTQPDVKSEDIPQSIIVISDMEIDEAVNSYWDDDKIVVESTMEKIRRTWDGAGLKLPHLVYWNVNARHDTILDRGENVTCVSGLSPVLFESILSGKTGIEVMLEKLNSGRYDSIHL